MKAERIWELDALRGIAIVLMVLFHTIFNLDVFFGLHLFNHMNGFWFYEGRIAAILFILLVGSATSIIAHRYPKKPAIQKNLKRGIKLIGFGLLITLVSYFFDSNNTIWFGILHFLGVSILISIPLARFKILNLLLGSLLLAGHYLVGQISTTNYLGVIFGIYPPSFQSYDHYALIPWLGYVLFGIAITNWLYPEGKAIIKRNPSVPEKALAVTGKYSLWIYLIHEPILLLITWLIFQAV
jgi:uncharacterized membrane protein